jgi:biopolymer transport protein ExbB
MVKLFLDGGEFMWPRASVNTRKFLSRIMVALEEGGVKAATEECEKTPGPVASIFHAGLSRANKGVTYVEKAITTAGSLEMAFLERGMVVLGTVIVLAPMLGFTGTVWGMVGAFDSIKKANDISPAIVAGGISQALLTTLFGLIVAMIIQVFNNYFSSKQARKYRHPHYPTLYFYC